MTFLRSLCIAVSMYSRIPVPYGNWHKKEMRYSIGLFPVVGVVIGVMTWLWLWGMHWIAAEGMTDLPEVVILLASTLIVAILPVLVTGGIHVDGFMDTSDAFHSWAEQGKKLQILSDPLGKCSGGCCRERRQSIFWRVCNGVRAGESFERTGGSAL